MYKIKSPNKNYNGTTFGVKFIDGIAETTELNIKNILVNDFHYTLVSEPKKTTPKPKTTANKQVKSNDSTK